MACCCGISEELTQGRLSEQLRERPHENLTPYTERKTRDLFCLLLYAVFWVGLLAITGVAILLGDPRRILYGLDGYGNTCGAPNSWDGEDGPDLTSRTKLYYLSPFDLLNPVNFIHGRSVCLEECPPTTAVCTVSGTECASQESFVCPYYRVAEGALYGTLTGVGNWSTSYWAELNSTVVADCPVNQQAPKVLAVERMLGLRAGELLPSAGSGVALPGECGRALQRSSAAGQGPCYPIAVDTADIFNRCMPKFDEKALKAVNNSTRAVWDAVKSIWDATRLERLFVDVVRGWTILVSVGIGAAIFFALLWLVLLRFFGGFMVWLSILAVNMSFIAAAVICFSLAGMLSSGGDAGQWFKDLLPDELGPADKDQQLWRWLGYAACAIEVVLFLISIVIGSRVRVAVAVIKVAVEAIGTIPALVTFPFLPLIAEAAFLVAWGVVAAFLWSTGEVVAVHDVRGASPPSASFVNMLAQSVGISDALDGGSNVLTPTPAPGDMEPLGLAECSLDPACHFELRWPTPLWYMAAYFVFGLFWTTQFISSFTTVVVSAAVANFYWNGGTRPGPRARGSPLAWAVGTAVCCHLGSVAMGSFILALVSFFRAILEYLHRKSKSAAPGSFCNTCFSSVRCCCWCFEKFLEFVNRHTLIMVGVKGQGYCASAARAAALMLTNVVRVAVVNTVSAFLMWIGKLLIMACCGALAFVVCDLAFFRDQENFPDTFLSSKIVPVLGCIVASYLISDVYFQVFDVVADTILLAYCEDCERNDGEPRYAPPLLLSAVELAARRKARAATGENAQRSMFGLRHSPNRVYSGP